ncbi:MAG: hypothetical protein U0W24_10895 [Bacteroidales bacterium]
MFVKNYLKLRTAMNHASNIFDLHDLFIETGEYLKTNPELVKAQDDFERLIKQQVADAVFSYYPELKPKEITLRKAIEEVIDEFAGEIFSQTFDIVYKYLENPDHFDHDKKWNWGILTEEEVLEEAIREAKDLSGEDREFSIKSSMHSRRVLNHKYYFNVVLQKAILNCLTTVFHEIPLLSGNGIRYLDYSMARQAYMLRDKMIGLFYKDLKEPEVDL